MQNQDLTKYMKVQITGSDKKIRGGWLVGWFIVKQHKLYNFFTVLTTLLYNKEELWII